MRADSSPIDYLHPDVPERAPWHELELVEATPRSLQGYGELVEDPSGFEVEIVPWPKSEGRPVDAGTGDQGGTVSGEFEFWWEGEILLGANRAVGDRYLFGWGRNPGEARRDAGGPRPCRVLLWHANYHPDGGQLFFPRDGADFVAPLALPGDDVTPERFVAFRVRGGRGLYIHPGVWHEGVFPLAPRGRFHDEQGRVHARVSCHFPREFGVFLCVPLPDETAASR